MVPESQVAISHRMRRRSKSSYRNCWVSRSIATLWRRLIQVRVSKPQARERERNVRPQLFQTPKILSSAKPLTWAQILIPLQRSLQSQLTPRLYSRLFAHQPNPLPQIQTQERSQLPRSRLQRVLLRKCQMWSHSLVIAVKTKRRSRLLSLSH